MPPSTSVSRVSIRALLILGVISVATLASIYNIRYISKDSKSTLSLDRGDFDVEPFAPFVCSSSKDRVNSDDAYKVRTATTLIF